MSVIDDYFVGVNDSQKTELERIRKIVKRAAPDAEEVISYGMPAFKYKKKFLIGFAGFKNHMSIFPTSVPVEVLEDKLAKFHLAKGTIQFTKANRVPEAIIKDLVAIRIAEIEQ